MEPAAPEEVAEKAPAALLISCVFRLNNVIMQQWEAEKINELYKELDRLKEENCKLKEVSTYDRRFDDMELKLDETRDAVIHITELLEEGVKSKKK